MKKWRKNIKRIFALGLTTVLIGSTIEFPASTVSAQTEIEISAEKDIKDSDIETKTPETDAEEQTAEQTDKEQTDRRKDRRKESRRKTK